jgi:hypothetical protein
LGNAGDYKIIGTDDDRAFDITEANSRRPQLGRPQTASEDSHFASGQSRGGSHRRNMRVAIHIFLAQQAVGDGHE